MHRGEALPLLEPSALMEKVVVVSSEKKLGAVLVVEKEKLLGIITDGDLRRALQHKEKFFRMRAEEIMTEGPITIGPDLLASSALQIMENRPSQINVLPVVDDENNYLGLLRLHDLLLTI